MRWGAAILLAAVLTTFASVLIDFHQVSDDVQKTVQLELLNHQTRGLVEKSSRLIFEAAGGGHYKPVQDVISAAFHHGLGSRYWARGTMALYLLMHAGSAILLATLLLRLGAGRTGALISGLLFALHPTLDEPLAAVQLAPNIPGLFFLMAAAVLWVGRGAESRGPSRLPVVAASALAFLSMGCNPIFLATAPLVLIGLDLSKPGRWGGGRLREVLARTGALAFATGVAVVIRLACYGSLGSTLPYYSKITPIGGGGSSIQMSVEKIAAAVPLFVEHAVLLRPSSHDTQLMEYQDAAPGTMMAFDSQSATVTGLAVLLACVFALVLMARAPGTESAESRPSWKSVRAQLLVGVVLLGGFIVPYLFLVSTSAPATHRYVQPAMAGAAAIVVGTLQILGRALRLSPGRARGVLLLILVPALSVMLLTDWSACRAIRHGHRMVRHLLDEVAKDLADEPAVNKLLLLGFPRCTGRAGYTWEHERHVRQLLAEDLGQRYSLLEDTDPDAVARGLEELAERTVVPWTWAVYQAEPQGLEFRRVRLVEQILPRSGSYDRLDTPRRLANLHQRWRLNDPAEVLKLAQHPDPESMRSLVRLLIQDGWPLSGLREMLQMALAELGAGVSPVPFPAATAPDVVVDILQASPEGSENLALGVLLDADGDPAVTQAGLEAAAGSIDRRQLRHLAWLAAVRTRGAWRPLLDLVPPDRSLDPTWLEDVVNRERRARALLCHPDSVAEAHGILQEIVTQYRQHGLEPFPEQLLALARARLFLGTASSEDHRLVRSETRLWETCKDGRSPRVALELLWPLPRVHLLGRKELICVAVLRNHSPLHLPGGASPFSGRVSWSIGGASDDQHASGLRLLPDAGVGPGMARRLTWRVPLPPTGARRTLRLEVQVLGRTIAREEISIEGP